MAIVRQNTFTYLKIIPERSIKLDSGKLYAYIVGFECQEARDLAKQREPKIKEFINNLTAYAAEHKDELTIKEAEFCEFMLSNGQFIFWSHERFQEPIHQYRLTQDPELTNIINKFEELGLDWSWGKMPIVYTDAILFDCDLLGVNELDIGLLYTKLKEYFNREADGDLTDC